jgi:hypothetical protein
LSVVGAHKNQFIQIRSVVKHDLKNLLEQDSEGKNVEDEFWTFQHQDQVRHVRRVAEQVIDYPRLLLALYVITTSAKCKDVTELFDLKRTSFRKDIAKVKIMLSEERVRTRKVNSFTWQWFTDELKAIR